jgi:hypothetical protein
MRKSASIALVLLLNASLVSAQPPTDPRLIEAQEGWVRLFDGDGTYGWTAEGGSIWRVEGGVLKADSGPSGWLRSEMPFSDFVLRLDFRTREATAKSAVYVHAGRQGNPGQTGFEVSIQDDGGPYLTGSIARFHAAPRMLTPPGQWKTMEVISRGAELSVSINGSVTAKVKTLHSKLGYFGLQHKEGSAVEFRNIRVKPIDFSCITNGRDLDGFRTVKPVIETPETTAWSFRDGAIHGEGGPGQIETVQAWDDMIWQVDVRAIKKGSNPEPQGALLFRGLRTGFESGYQIRFRNEVPAEGGLADTTGALSGLSPARKLAATSNTWATITVLAVGRDLAVWVNGDLVNSLRDMRTLGPNNPTSTARILRGTTGLLIRTPPSSFDMRSYCVKRMNR